MSFIWVVLEKWEGTVRVDAVDHARHRPDGCVLRHGGYHRLVLREACGFYLSTQAFPVVDRLGHQKEMSMPRSANALVMRGIWSRR